MTNQRRAPIYERAYLAGYDVGRAGLYSRHRAAFLVRAGVLLDLADASAAREVDGRVRVSASVELGDPVLVGVAVGLSGHPRSWRSAIRHGYKHTFEVVERHLLEVGVLSAPERSNQPRSIPVVADSAAVVALQARIRTLLIGDEPAARVAPADAAVAVLAAVGGAPPAPSGYRVRHRTRYHALAAQAGTLTPGVESALRRLKWTIIGAKGGVG